jgi:hypothetical protein
MRVNVLEKQLPRARCVELQKRIDNYGDVGDEPRRLRQAQGAAHGTVLQFRDTAEILAHDVFVGGNARNNFACDCVAAFAE